MSTKNEQFEKLDFVGRYDGESREAKINEDKIIIGLYDDYVDFQVTDKKVNQYSLFESFANWERKSPAYFRKNSVQIRLIYRSDGEWYFSELDADPSSPPRERKNSEYVTTVVDGIDVNQIASRGGGRKSGFSKRRLKITRGFVDRVDEPYIIEYQMKVKEGKKGRSRTLKNKTAYRLIPEE